MILDIEPDLDVIFDMATKNEKRKLVSNALLLQELSMSKYENRVSERLQHCIWILVSNLKARKWPEMSYKEYLIQEAFCYTCSKALMNDSVNPYAWFVQVINNSFKRTTEQEKINRLAIEFDRLMK